MITRRGYIITSIMLWLSILVFATLIANSPSYANFADINSLRVNYMRIQSKSWNLIEQHLDVPKVTEALRAKITRELFNYHINFIENNLTAVEQRYTHDTVGAKSAFPEVNHLYEWKYIESDLHVINNLFETMRLYLQQGIEYDVTALSATDFAQTVLEDKTWPIPKLFEKIDRIMVGQGLYFKVAMEHKNQLCAARRSGQQVLYQMYSAVALTEFKAYAMMQFSWMLLRTFNVGNFTKEAELLRERYEQRSNNTQHILRKVIQQADNEVWRCDPEEHLEGVTYVRLTKLLQGYIENEVDMNDEGTCRETCGYYKYAESMACFKELYCAQQPQCTGKLLNCQYVDSDMWICPAKPKSLRRYEYIEYENGRVMGKKGSCTRGTTKVDSWWRYLFWHCSYCLCICDEQSYLSDRYFSLKEVVSNVAENRVVTGVRLRKKDRIIHLQIQEGELMPNGQINQNTTAWQEIKAFRLTDRSIQDGRDYHTMAWNTRAIDLDNVEGQVGTVVTGVKFGKIGSHLNLEVQLTEFNYETGKLMDPHVTSVWHANVNGITKTEITLDNPSVPTDGKGKSLVNQKPNQFIEFTHSGFDADAAQTTVPYLDAQDVTTIPPVPLIGIGLYHKAIRGNGGFVGPKLLTYDITQHISKPMTNSVA